MDDDFMSFLEDRVPACRYEGHPQGYDRRRYMQAAEISDTHVVWACLLCSDIYKVPIVQVFVLPRGKDKAQYLRQAQSRGKRV
jgi:hypothetical protein